MDTQRPQVRARVVEGDRRVVLVAGQQLAALAGRLASGGALAYRGEMLVGVIVALLQGPPVPRPETGPPPPPTTMPVTREYDAGPFRMTTTSFLAWRPVANRRFGFDVALQPIYIVDLEARLPVLRHLVIQLESAPALHSGLVAPVHARLQLKLPRNARIGLEQTLLGVFTAGLARQAGAFAVPTGPRAVFRMKF